MKTGASAQVFASTDTSCTPIQRHQSIHRLRQDPRRRGIAKFGVQAVDVALSTTALHRLPPAQFVLLYTELGTLIRPDGLFLSGDPMAYAPGMEPFRRVQQLVSLRAERAAEQKNGGERWSGWWEALEAEPSLGEHFAERKRGRPERTHGVFDLS